VDELIGYHRRACERFSAVVDQVGGRWEVPSPCERWDVTALVEHVIGFHDVLLLRPMGTKPTRPRGDPRARWGVTVPAIFLALQRATDPDPDAPSAPPTINLERLLPGLTTEVLVHTWDVAVALSIQPDLDPEVCELSYESVRRNEERVRASGMFGPTVEVPPGADPAVRLVAALGRDPTWTARA
jgi:uncharacterized protein (TIGR03086 family)